MIGIAMLAALLGTQDMAPEASLTPTDAIVRAAEAAPGSVPGTFVLRVQAAGREGGRVYLNSEMDYRDQRNLTVNIAPAAARALQRQLGVRADRFFSGRRIAVRGAAQRMRIGFFSGGRPTGLYYYQTHVHVTEPAQIQILD